MSVFEVIPTVLWTHATLRVGTAFVNISRYYMHTKKRIKKIIFVLRDIKNARRCLIEIVVFAYYTYSFTFYAFIFSAIYIFVYHITNAFITMYDIRIVPIGVLHTDKSFPV